MSYVDVLRAIPQPEQRSKEWYEQRTSLLTSSNIATILGMNPYKKPAAYMQDLLFPEQNPFRGNLATVHGTYYEDASIDAYMDAFAYSGVNLGLIRIVDNVSHRQYEHVKDLHWLAGSVDKLVWPEEIELPQQADCIAVENKCPFNQPTLKYGAVKSYYWPQVQFNMFILDTDRGDYIEMVPKGFRGHEFHMNVVRVYRDDAWIQGFALPRLEEFYLEWQDKARKNHKRKLLAA